MSDQDKSMAMPLPWVATGCELDLGKNGRIAVWRVDPLEESGAYAWEIRRASGSRIGSADTFELAKVAVVAMAKRLGLL